MALWKWKCHLENISFSTVYPSKDCISQAFSQKVMKSLLAMKLLIAFPTHLKDFFPLTVFQSAFWFYLFRQRRALAAERVGEKYFYTYLKGILTFICSAYLPSTSHGACNFTKIMSLFIREDWNRKKKLNWKVYPSLLWFQLNWNLEHMNVRMPFR